MDTVTSKFLKHYIGGSPVEATPKHTPDAKGDGDEHANIVQYQGGAAAGVGS